LDSVATLTAKDVKDFYKTYYTRANLVVSVVGDIAPDEVIALVDEHLAPLPAGTQVAWPEAPKKVTPALVHTKREVPQSSILMGRMGIGRTDALYYPTLVMNEVLGGGVLTSRLFTEVREKHGLAYDVRSVNTPLPGGGLYYAAVQTNNQTAEKALTLMRAELELMRTKGVTAEELQDIKDYLIGSFPLRLDSNSKILGYLTMMQTEGLGLTYLDDWTAAVKAVSAADVLQAAQGVLDFKDSVLVIVGDGPALELK
jgi:zinc protease